MTNIDTPLARANADMWLGFAADFRAPPFFAELRLLLDFLEERFFVAMPDLLQELVNELQANSACARAHHRA